MRAKWASGPRPTASLCSTISITAPGNTSAARRALAGDRMKLFYCVFLLACGALWAQTAGLRGVVTDESGGVVPGATVSLQGSPRGVMKTAISAKDGSWAIPGLPPGRYSVDATAPQLTL